MSEILEYLYPHNRQIDSQLEQLLGTVTILPPVDYESGQHALERFTERDSILITYGDQFSGPDHAPLHYLHTFLKEALGNLIRGVHILPFFPFSSDDGFSISDYLSVDLSLGQWDDVSRIGKDFCLMADLVLNHCSSQHPWFQAFLRDEAPYNEYFITVGFPDIDLSEVFRPRSSPLLTPFETAKGTRYVWTTFSPDQVDLNFQNPQVLLKMVSVLLEYLRKGVQIIRLDAVAYVWKELGTSCIHHPKTHALVQLLRQILRRVAPWVMIITETNVPHRENISYFGEGNEAHMVYQFSLPPLVLDAILRRDAGHLQTWAASLSTLQTEYSFFNFTASHDGIGLLPAQNFLSTSETTDLIRTVESRGGHISMKSTDKGEIPYEANINYFSAINDGQEHSIQRFLLSQAIPLVMAGIPGIYVHSLIGSENWKEGVEETAQWRSINRKKLEYDQVTSELSDSRSGIFNGYRQLLIARMSSPAFSPLSPQEILPSDVALFVVLRGPWKDRWVLCVHNFSTQIVEFPLPPLPNASVFRNLITHEEVHPLSGLVPFLRVFPEQILWVEPA